MFISSMWDVKEPTHYEVPGVVAALCKGIGGVGEVKYGLSGADVRPHTTKSEIII